MFTSEIHTGKRKKVCLQRSLVKSALIILLLMINAISANATILNGSVESNDTLINVAPPEPLVEPIQIQLPKSVNNMPLLSPMCKLRISRDSLNGQLQQTALTGQVQKSNLTEQVQNNLLNGQAQSFGDSLQPTFPKLGGYRQPQSAMIQHGEMPIGVVGLISERTDGLVLSVLPPSDLNRFGIHPGDRIIGYLGHRFVNGYQMERELVGTPGSILDMTFIHNGQVITIYPHRVDARLLVRYDNTDDHHFIECANRTSFW